MCNNNAPYQRVRSPIFFSIITAAVPDRFIPVRVEELNIGYIDGMLCVPGRLDGVDVCDVGLTICFC